MATSVRTQDNKHHTSGNKRKRRSWDESYEALKEYHDKHGHCNLSEKTPLGKWAHQNRSKNRSKLTDERRAKLNALGFDWESQAEKVNRRWLEMLECLKRYIREHGDARVPTICRYEGVNLGSWVSEQRKAYKNGKLLAKRIEKLETVGFLWVVNENLVWKEGRNTDAIDAAWNTMYELLVEFHRDHNHCFVPVSYDVHDPTTNEMKRLGTWVYSQRMTFNDGLLKEDRRERLDKLGFVWKVDHFDADSGLKQRKWDEMFGRLVQFKKDNGHCRVPSHYLDEDCNRLGQWGDVQRAKFSTGTLDKNRLDRLDALGFPFDVHEDYWNTMYCHLKAYKLKHGNCRVPEVYTTIDGAKLGQWVRVQRKANMRKSHCGAFAARRKKLNALGFVWDEIKLRWDDKYERLKKFHREHGHCRVPKKYDDGTGGPTSLYNFVSRQRQFLRGKTKNPVKLKRIQLLNAIDFPWEVPIGRP